MKRIIWTVIAGLIPFALYWLGGGNFERGEAFGITTGGSFVAMFLVYNFYGKIDL